MADASPPGRPAASRPGNPPAPSQPTEAQPPEAGDPSMEDILASIRRILNEDEPAGSAGPPPPQPPPAGDEPLDLTREMLVSGPSTPAKPAPKSAPPGAAGPPAQAAPPQTEPAAPAEGAQPAPAADPLLAPAVAAAASASLGHLLRTVAAERGSAVVRSGGPTIEDVVREELRPLLKEWLDQHLPAVVERLVRLEIERVVGRALS